MRVSRWVRLAFTPLLLVVNVCLTLLIALLGLVGTGLVLMELAGNGGRAAIAKALLPLFCLLAWALIAPLMAIDALVWKIAERSGPVPAEEML